MISGVNAEDINAIWPTIEHLVQKPLTKTKSDIYYDTDDIKNYIKSRDMQLWVAIDNNKIIAIFVTQVLIFPKRKVFDIFLVGGSGMNKWITTAWRTFKAYATEQHCDGIRGFGREGWTKVLPDKITINVNWDIDL